MNTGTRRSFGGDGVMGHCCLSSGLLNGVVVRLHANGIGAPHILRDWDRSFLRGANGRLADIILLLRESALAARPLVTFRFIFELLLRGLIILRGCIHLKR